MTATSAPRIAIVVPCYNEESVLPISIPVLTGILDHMAAEGLASDDSYILCCDDRSTDSTWSVIEQLHQADKRVKGILLAHNRGQQKVLLAGLMSARQNADAAVTIDADLQDSPEAIIDMVRLFRSGKDVVYGVRSDRSSDSWFKRESAQFFYKLQQKLGLETIYDHSEFRLMSRRALDLLSDYGESNIFLRGMFPMIGLESAIVTYVRTPRIAGETKYHLGKLLSGAIDGITSFTARPMRLIFGVGMILLLIDIVVSVWVLSAYFCGKTISGWSSLMLSIWFLGSLILIALGIIGEYIGKIFVEVKHRPRYAIQKELL